MTEYVLLCKNDDEVGWMEVRRVQARSATAAIREVAAEYSPPSPAWVATPARSFRPVTVKVETKTALRFS